VDQSINKYAARRTYAIALSSAILHNFVPLALTNLKVLFLKDMDCCVTREGNLAPSSNLLALLIAESEAGIHT
jgi:hypothetical protein